MPDRAPTDLVVVLPGITGSTLLHEGRPVWEPSAGALVHALLTLGGSLRRLQLPAGIGDEHPGDGVTVGALVDDVTVIPGLWTPIKGYGPLVARLEQLGYRRPTADTPGNLVPMPYDWRLSNRYTAAWMAPQIERELGRWRAQGGRYADAKVTLVGHSMGGLVARRYAAAHGGDHVRRIVTLGTPMRGSMNAVEILVNGSPISLGPIARLITDLARTLPSLHQLLPAYACVVTDADPEHLRPDGLPGGDAAMVGDGLAFYTELEAAEAAAPDSADDRHAIVGTNQPTQSTVRFGDGRAELVGTYGDEDFQGDATVPLVGAIPAGLPLDTNRVRRVPDNHGNLQRNAAALDELEGILTARPVVIKGLSVPLSAGVPEVVVAGEPLVVSIGAPAGHEPQVVVRVHASGRRARDRSKAVRLTRGRATLRFADLAPGAYVVDIAGATPGSPVAPVSAATLVWDPAASLP